MIDETTALAFFEALHEALADGESYRLEVSRDGAKLNVAVIPALLKEPEQLPDAAKNVRAALAMPLVFREPSIQALAESFARRLSGYALARSGTQAGFDDLIASLKDAEAEAKNAKNAKQKEGGKDSKAKSQATKVVDDAKAPKQPDQGKDGANAPGTPADVGKGLLDY